MRVLRPGTIYGVENFNEEEGKVTHQRIVFVERSTKGAFIAGMESEGLDAEAIAENLDRFGLTNKPDTESFILFNGTTNEELLDVLCDRIDSINYKSRSYENEEALRSLRVAKMWLKERKENKNKRRKQ